LNDFKKPDRSLPGADDFVHWTRDNIRFGDLDIQGHVNNTVIAGYFETGRVTMFRERGLGLGGGTENVHVALVHAEMTFVRELRWPGTVEIGTAVLRLGRTSCTLRHGLFSGGHCVAHGTATLVLIDAASRRPAPIPEALAARLTQWSRPAPQP